MGHVKQFISLRFARAKYTLQHEIYTGCPRSGSLTRFIAKVFKYMQNREHVTPGGEKESEEKVAATYSVCTSPGF